MSHLTFGKGVVRGYGIYMLIYMFCGVRICKELPLWNTMTIEFLSTFSAYIHPVMCITSSPIPMVLQLFPLPQASRGLISALTKLSPWNPVEVRLSACRFGTAPPFI